MAIINYKGDIERNLQEQVAENKRLILQHYNTTRTLELLDVRVIGTMETWEEPTGTFEYGDAFFVGTEAPYSLYIYTRADGLHPNPYWLAIEDLIVQGPEGKPLTWDDLTPEQKASLKGETGTSTRWYSYPTGNYGYTPSLLKDGDQRLEVGTGNVYQWETDQWVFKGSIKGKDGVGISTTKINADGQLLISYTNGTQVNLGKVVGSAGRDGKDGKDGITTVVNIIGELPAGSIISNTFNPETVEPNSGVIMPVDGTNHIFIVVDGIWTDAGPFSGGSSVYAGGQFQNTFDADTKLDKKGSSDLPQSGRGAVYGLTNTGEQILYKIGLGGSFNQNTDKEGIPVYDASGYLYSRQPGINEAISSRVATCGWVNQKILNAHSNTETFHLGVFGTQTDDVSGLPQYNIPIAPFGDSSNIQMKCDLIYYDGNAYYNVPIPLYIDFSFAPATNNDGTLSFSWTIIQATNSGATMCQGTGIATTKTDTTLENAYFQINDNDPFSEVYITIHCPHDTSWYFPQS